MSSLLKTRMVSAPIQARSLCSAQRAAASRRERAAPSLSPSSALNAAAYALASPAKQRFLPCVGHPARRRRHRAAKRRREATAGATQRRRRRRDETTKTTALPPRQGAPLSTEWVDTNSTSMQAPRRRGAARAREKKKAPELSRRASARVTQVCARRARRTPAGRASCPASATAFRTRLTHIRPAFTCAARHPRLY